MTTRLQVSRDYPDPVAAFAAALADPAFHSARLDTGSGGEVVSHRQDGAAITVVLRQPVPAEAVPRPIARLLGGALVITRTERWTLSDTRLAAVIDVVVPRAPVVAGGSTTVTATAGGSRLGIDVGVRVTVPLAGAFVEPSVVEGIRDLTAVEHDNIAAYLRARTGSA